MQVNSEKRIEKKDLEKESTRLDVRGKIQKNATMFNILIIIIACIIGFFLILFELSDFILYLFIGTFILLFIVFLRTELSTPTLTEREEFSFYLLRIADAVKMGSTPIKYAKPLFEISERYAHWEQRKINDLNWGVEDSVFQENSIEEIKEKMEKRYTFWKNLNRFALKLNHAILYNNLEKLDPELIYQVGMAIYYRDRNLVQLSNKLVQSYDYEEMFPSFWHKTKLLFYTRPARLLFYEVFLGLFLLVIYAFIYNDKQTIINGFFLITTAIMLILFTQKK